MAIKNTLLGGVDNANGEIIDANDVNDTNDAMINEIIDERTELNGDYEVLSGCLVTVNSPEDTAINIASGKVLINGLIVSVAEQLNETLSSADGSNPRYDVICVDNTGVISVITGTPATTPVVPVLTADKCPLATILRPAGNDNALDDNLYDGRYFRNKPFITSDNVENSVSGTAGSAGWLDNRKNLTIPPFVCRKYIKIEWDMSGRRSGAIGGNSRSYTGNAIRLRLNGTTFVTKDQSVVWYNSGASSHLSYVTYNSHYYSEYLTEDNGVNFSQFTTIQMDIYRNTYSGGASEEFFNGFNRLNHTFIILGE